MLPMACEEGSACWFFSPGLLTKYINEPGKIFSTDGSGNVALSAATEYGEELIAAALALRTFSPAPPPLPPSPPPFPPFSPPPAAWPAWLIVAVVVGALAAALALAYCIYRTCEVSVVAVQ